MSNKTNKLKKTYETNLDFIKDINECVKKYHNHTSIFYKDNYIPSKKQIKKTTKIKKLKYSNKPRELPYMKFNKKNKIGYIRFYQYNLPSLKDMKSAEKIAEKFGKKVANKIKNWKKQNMKGLIIDLRYHYGGSIMPFYYSMTNIFNNSTLLAWSKKKAKKDEKVWINIVNHKILYDQKFLNDKLNINIPIAVIIGPDTTSSGEIAAASFYGKDNVKFFGKRTYGMLSVNYPYQINRDILINLTGTVINTTDLKFHKKEYLKPNIITNIPVIDAKKWINSFYK